MSNTNKRITDDRIAEIINKGVKEMPSNPASRGHSQEEIRKYFYVPEEEILKEMQGLEDDLTDKINKVLTEEEKAKLDKIVIDGDGNRYLADNGKYQEVKNINLENGQGENSIQLPPDGEDFTYSELSENGETVLRTFSFVNETTGKESFNLSTKGKVERNYHLNIGQQNVIEFQDGEEKDLIDGGATIGYRNYTNAANNLLSGKWNKIINVTSGFIGGYKNTTKTNNTNKSHGSFNFGEQNYLAGNPRNTVLLGAGLKNWTTGPFQYHFGKFNKPANGIFLTVGNGLGSTNTSFFFMKDYTNSAKNAPSITLEEALAKNNAIKTSDIPIKEEGILYLCHTDPNTGKSLSAYTEICEDNRATLEKYWEGANGDYGASRIYELRYDRSNLLQGYMDGRLELIRRSTVKPLAENDLLTKKEIENLISNSSGTKFYKHTVNFRVYGTDVFGTEKYNDYYIKLLSTSAVKVNNVFVIPSNSIILEDESYFIDVDNAKRLMCNISYTSEIFKYEFVDLEYITHNVYEFWRTLQDGWEMDSGRNFNSTRIEFVNSSVEDI
ncbi:MAG: hypothetical protein IKA85_06750 [Clostridia bacterium]|nr:hypothetical protein [Clostridia bacterium]